MRFFLELDFGEEFADHLKRLALFCDEFLYLTPRLPFFDVSDFDDSKRFRRDASGHYTVVDFEFFRDCRAYIRPLPESLDPPLRDTLQCLIEEGIAKPAEQLPPDEAASFTALSNAIAARDARDQTFARLSGTPKDAYKISNLFDTSQQYRMETPDGSKSITVVGVNVPPAIEDSQIITTALYHAGRSNGYPLLPERKFAAELNYKLRQHELDASLLTSIMPSEIGEELARSAKSASVVFTFAAAVLQNAPVRDIPVEKIVRYRREMNEARVRLVSNALLELNDLVEGSPWSDRSHAAVNAYVRGKLKHDLQAFDSQTADAWDKFFGKATSQAVRLAGAFGVGGGAGGLVASVLPNATPLQMVLLGALAAMGRELPQFSDVLVERLLELRKQRRSGIAYIAGLRRLQKRRAPS